VKETNSGHGHHNPQAPHEKMHPAPSEPDANVELAASTPSTWDGICLSAQEPEAPQVPQSMTNEL
jgi:hypothetical protein